MKMPHALHSFYFIFLLNKNHSLNSSQNPTFQNCLAALGATTIQPPKDQIHVSWSVWRIQYFLQIVSGSLSALPHYNLSTHYPLAPRLLLVVHEFLYLGSLGQILFQPSTKSKRHFVGTYSSQSLFPRPLVHRKSKYISKRTLNWKSVLV